MMNVLSISLSTSFIILAIVIIRVFFVHKLPKKTFMTLWGVVVCRLLIPVSIPSRFNVLNIIDMLRTALGSSKELSNPASLTGSLDNMLSAIVPDNFGAIIPEMTHTAAQGGANTAAPNISNIAATYGPSLLFWIWVAGACACALYFLITHLRHRNVYKIALPVKSSFFIERWLHTHPLSRKIRINQSDKIDAPLTYGMFRPVILLPNTIDLQDEARLSYILTHEYVHIKRFDTLLKWILAGTLALHWFNPLIWVMYILANRDMELSCDEAVVRLHGEDEKSAYAMTLLGLAEKRSSILSLCSNFSKNAVEERVVSIMKIKKFSSFSVIVAIAVVFGITIVFATTKAAPNAKAVTPPSVSASVGGSDALVQDILSNIALAATDTQPVHNPYAVSDHYAMPYPLSEIAALAANSDFEHHVECMFFVTESEPNQMKVTYDGQIWEPCSTNLEEMDWKWLSYEEVEKYVEEVITMQPTYGLPGAYYTMNTKLDNETEDPMVLIQTLTDIRNGIRVSKNKSVYLMNGDLPADISSEVAYWYCFGYTFKDLSGNTVDLGLFETRDGLFAALKQYYDKEVKAGRITQAKADDFYGQVAHSIRYKDEVPLFEKLKTLKYIPVIY